MVNYKLLINTIGLLFLAFGITLILPSFVSFYYDDGEIKFLLTLAFISFLIGGLTWIIFKSSQIKESIKLRDGFLLVVVIWVVFAFLSAIPFVLMQHPISITDAVFESFSGLTTTGATIMSNLEEHTPSMLFYRQQLQWFGGMGLIVLAVAILPILGVGAMQLYQVEITGPIKDDKISPSIAQSAKILWKIYVGFTLACILAYYLAGMSLFDAICHSFSTVSIGGMSPYDDNFAHFNDNDAILWVASFFMTLSAINFSLHYLAISQKSLKTYYSNVEWRAFIYILLLVITFATIYLTHQNYQKNDSFYDALLLASFQSISFITTTGYTSDNIALWPHTLILILFLFSFIGGCSGSTAGGVKVIRLIAFIQSGLRQIFLSIHPNAISRVRVGNRMIEDKVISYVWGFFSLYVLCFVTIFVAMLLLGTDLETSFSLTATTINNLGPALGSAITDFSSLSDTAKWILCASMLLGRLEVIGVLVLFSSYFWR